MFTQELIQAVSDWQQGGYPKTKAKRGLALRAEAEKLPARYRVTDAVCYRQVGLTEMSLVQLGYSWELPETISAWTKSESIARDFKDGVPPPGNYRGAIFRITPPENSVVVDFTALFAAPEFLVAVEQCKGRIRGFADGLGRYGNSQQEVVLEVGKLELASLCAWGGHSSEEYKLAEIHFGHPPSPNEIADFRQAMNNAGVKAGPYWMFTPDAVDRINECLISGANRKVARAVAHKARAL